MTSDYLAGIEFLELLGIENDEARNRAAELAPDFVKLAIGFAYGSLLNRPGLDLKTRMIATIASAVTGNAPVDDVRKEIFAALQLGWSREEIIDTIVQCARQVGIPATLSALAKCHDLLASMPGQLQSGKNGADESGQE